jgi:hypothetical protein
MKKNKVYCRDCAHRFLKDIDRCREHDNKKCKSANKSNQCPDHALIYWGEIKSK